MSTTAEVRLVANTGWDARVLVCASGRLVQTFVVVSDRYVVLVDTMATPADAAALLAVAGPHLVGRQLLVVNTHADWDHAWGNQVFAGPQATHPAPLIGSRRCAKRLRSAEARQELATMQAQEPGRFDAVQLTPPTLAFDGALVIDGGDLTVVLLPTPGHQPDHLALFLPEASLLLAGDAAELPFPLVNDPRDLPLLRASLDQMAALGARHALYCHAPVAAGTAVLDANRAYFDTLEQRCRAALAAQGSALLAPGAEVEALVGWSFAQAIPALWPRDAAAEEDVAFYTDAHRQAIRAMCVWLTSAKRG